MKTWKFFVLMMGGLAWASCAQAGLTTGNQTVTLSNVHICCGQCVEIINDTAATVPGVTANPDEDAKTIVLVGPDKATLQKEVNALVAAGFYGTSSDPDIKVSAPSGATAGKVTSLQVAGVHLCCPQCVKTVNKVLATVPGVTGNDASAGAKTFTVTGNFEPAAVFVALNQAGMAGHVAAPAAVTQAAAASK